ncbi:proteasome lid subunit RPN8/RPN11 [Thermosporothrix hazakensis]|jgi:proteasome lid subunit RPN8/RPN11|uniref:Proteasome lid subunit RPN8/RPN11 n=2 Tax=Thermosporothrix TaxID=768650 RepID=A0A326U9T9_THEHA|nr:Mov34/MPN/PAD-1 family protein [Thermosporothrix hazakensis]PZW31953.1 proteasome lid subunit RPN8/RPN11 [Thermosporothrix hazakensis]BBH91576.1 hypothetical protein KTC_63270 [Thermosporothrix sp. COM3]GCE49722.1 hypothetical protein KTH_45910 [Thermosporothrix hazakensis]
MARQRVTLSLQAYQEILTDIYTRPQIEACGLLLGRIEQEKHWHVCGAKALRNIFQSPVYFEFAPEELLEAELTYPEQIIGVYHSHPTGYRKASQTDRTNMQRVNVEQQIPWIWLIVCGPFEQSPTTQHPILAYYHDAHAGLQHLSLTLEHHL